MKLKFTDPSELAVQDTAVVSTMYPTVCSFRTSGGVIATVAA